MKDHDLSLVDPFGKVKTIKVLYLKPNAGIILVVSAVSLTGR
jgi:hypothetical protein